jgi:hypothetical protein
MMTPPDIEAQILRFYHAEKWTMGTIARQLHIHYSVVQRPAGAEAAVTPRPISFGGRTVLLPNPMRSASASCPASSADRSVR